MGRLLAWLVDDSHLVPLMASDTKDYVKRYMKAAIAGKDTDAIQFRKTGV